MKYEHYGRRNHQKGNCYIINGKQEHPGDKLPPQSNIANTKHFDFMMTSYDKNLQNYTPDSVVFNLDSEVTDYMINRDDIFTSWFVLSTATAGCCCENGRIYDGDKAWSKPHYHHVGFYWNFERRVIYTRGYYQLTIHSLNSRGWYEGGVHLRRNTGVTDGRSGILPITCGSGVPGVGVIVGVQNKMGNIILTGKTYNG
ncbi:hypothetical protein Zmor_017891 [Zophobas morio]|uniref:Uncharacterized protein n=1 Tax=Zophobas morio TaxID=2755281 RepID=A0AA38I9L6_9CUCU|nr:hypothetical protein Zmor_017891 [Zophobas morio]